MPSKNLLKLAALSLALIPGVSAIGQTYSNAVMALNPVGYWPLSETAQPPQPLNLTAKNLGTLGAAGNGYYGAWYQPSGATWYITNNIVQGQAITYPNDGSMGMVCQGAPGQYVIVPRNTNGVANAGIVLNPPFSIEAWIKIGTTASALGDIVSQGGFASVNFGGPNTNNPFYGGLGTGWAGVELGQYQDYIFFACQATNAVNNKGSELDTTPYNAGKGFKVGQWVHVVATFDGATETIWTNGVSSVSKNLGANGAGLKYVVDPTSPLMIGNGSLPPSSYGQGFTGTIDDVAIYNSVLSQTSIQNHYQAAYGTSATYGANYTNSVLADGPVLYYRLNDPQTQINAGYPTNTFPVANNYGSAGAAASGFYQPGTTPGLAGPSYAGFGANSKAVAFNGWFGGVDVGGGSLPSSLNPTGTVPLTVVTWFKSGPADAPGRFQEMLGHGDKSYRFAMGQVAAENHFNPGPGPELQFTTAVDVATNGFAFNDGQWHMAAGVSDGTNEYLYLDGALAKTASNATGINIVGNTNDLLIGGDSQYTYATFNGASTPNTIRTFDGQVAQVGFWTNALSPAQVQQLFNSAVVPPYSWAQPVSSITLNSGQNLTFPANIRGSSVAYQWYQNGLAVAGQTNFNLAYTPITTNNAGSYYVIASGSGGSLTSSVVNVTVYGVPTVLQQTPAQLNIFAGSSPTLHVTAAGASPIQYQWTLNDSPITGATNTSFTVTNIQGDETYGCLMTNILGTGSLTPVAVTVLSDPTNPFPSRVLADGPVAYFRLDEASGTTAYDYVGGNNGTYTNVVLGMSGYDSLQSVQSDPTETAAGFGFISPPNNYVGDVPSYLNFGMPNGSNAEFSVEAWVTDYIVNNTNAIVALGYGGGGEQFVLDCGSGSAGTLRFFVRNAAGTVSSANSTNQIADDGFWHHVVGVCDEAGGHVYVYLDGKQVGSGTITAASGLLRSSTPLSIGARQSANNGNTNYDYQLYAAVDDVAVYNKALSAAQVQAHYYAQGSAPIITGVTPSSNWTTNQGANASFTVNVAGTSPLTYQWTDNSGNVIPWATTNTLVLTNVQPSQAGNYTVNVSNPYGGPVSTSINLMVTQVPEIVSDIAPSNVAVYATEPVTLSVTIAGTAPLHYQWYQNGTAIPNATNTTYTVAALLGVNTYYLSVTNAYSAGSPTVSSTATITGMPATFLTPANYTDNMKITFNGYNRSETLADFPVLVRIGTNLPGFSYSHFASSAGADLRFTDAGGTRVIPSEIDEWNPNGVSTVWVQVPALSGTNTTILAYWGNPAATTALPGTNVWIPQSWEGLPSYDIVYHLKEGSFPFADSTGQNPALTGVAPAQATGIVGTGASFDGATSYLDAGYANLTDPFTMSAWVDVIPTANSSGIETVWANQKGGFGSAGFAMFINGYSTTNGDYRLATGDGTSGSSGTENGTGAGTVSFGQWHLLSIAVSQSNHLATFFEDGNVVGSSATWAHGFPIAGVDLNLGRFTNNSLYFEGTMDEARIHSGIESSNWIWASWMTVQQNSSLASYSAITSTVTNPPAPITINVKFTGSPGAASLTLSGSGGQASGTYYIIGTTNLALPVTQWTVLSTNSFDGSGNFNISVPVSPSKPQQYLRIKE